MEIVAAVGLSLGDLFPQRLADSGRRVLRARHLLSAHDAIDALAHETAVVTIAAADIVAGRSISSGDLERLALARHRISRLREIVQ